MVTARRVFESVGEINDCLDELMGELPKRQFVGVELVNRLRGEKGGVREIVLVVLVDRIRCEIHLVLRDRVEDRMVNGFIK
jgi:hypothetical protein